MAYISFRFRFSFGIGAMVASIHDVLITLSFLTFFGYELSLNVIAAILTLVGYGVNDQIVIFDRVRENLRMHRSEPMNVVINKSVNQTLPRTVITAGATALAVLSLYLFGGVVLEPFAFAMLVGIITSTYSTVFIASAVAVLLSPRAEGSQGGAGERRRRQAGRQAVPPGEGVLTYLSAALLGVVQGLTEFLPISSTAHLLLGARVLGYQDPGGVFTVMIQLGAVLAVVWLYRAKIRERAGGPADARAGPAVRAGRAARLRAGVRRRRAACGLREDGPVLQPGRHGLGLRGRRPGDAGGGAVASQCDRDGAGGPDAAARLGRRRVPDAGARARGLPVGLHHRGRHAAGPGPRRGGRVFLLPRHPDDCGRLRARPPGGQGPADHRPRPRDRHRLRGGVRVGRPGHPALPSLRDPRRFRPLRLVSDRAWACYFLAAMAAGWQ